MSTETDATNVARSPLDKPRAFVVAAVAVVLLVPLVFLVMKGTSSEPVVAPVPVPPVAASTYDQDINLARTLLDTGKARDALVPLERAQKANPTSFAVYNNQCVAYGILQRRDEAVTACQHALQIDPANQLGKNNLAWVQSIKPSAAP